MNVIHTCTLHVILMILDYPYVTWSCLGFKCGKICLLHVFSVILYTWCYKKKEKKGYFKPLTLIWKESQFLWFPAHLWSMSWLGLCARHFLVMPKAGAPKQSSFCGVFSRKPLWHQSPEWISPPLFYLCHRT